MNYRRYLALVPHYLANLVLVFLAIGALRFVAGDTGLVVELAAVVVVVIAYPSIVRALGLAPDVWEDPGGE